MEEGDDQNLKGIVPRYGDEPTVTAVRLTLLFCKQGGTVEHKGFNYLRLENLNGQFSIPCCMDIKMGTRSNYF